MEAVINDDMCLTARCPGASSTAAPPQAHDFLPEGRKAAQARSIFTATNAALLVFLFICRQLSKRRSVAH